MHWAPVGAVFLSPCSQSQWARRGPRWLCMWSAGPSLCPPCAILDIALGGLSLPGTCCLQAICWSPGRQPVSLLSKVPQRSAPGSLVGVRSLWPQELWVLRFHPDPWGSFCWCPLLLSLVGRWSHPRRLACSHALVQIPVFRSRGQGEFQECVIFCVLTPARLGSC